MPGRIWTTFTAATGGGQQSQYIHFRYLSWMGASRTQTCSRKIVAKDDICPLLVLNLK